jgi:hypothetical protein
VVVARGGSSGNLACGQACLLSALPRLFQLAVSFGVDHLLQKCRPVDPHFGSPISRNCRVWGSFSRRETHHEARGRGGSVSSQFCRRGPSMSNSAGCRRQLISQFTISLFFLRNLMDCAWN